MNDYERMARVIRLLDAGFRRQPRLDDLAAAAGLSPSHFHRLFTRWVGVTPKDFVQCLTAEHAKRLLRAGANVLEASLASGLSGPSRLHDLCVALEASTPGEVGSGGRGLEIACGFATTPFGRCLVAHTPRGLLSLAFIDDEQPEALERLAAEWPAAVLTRSDAAAQSLVTPFFSRPAARPDSLKLLVRGSRFQVQVWRALLRIPPGVAVSYGQLARALDRPGAARAVGQAVGANPIACLIPCHRVIRETGALGHYRWGAGRKRALLAWEAAAHPASRLDEAPARP